MITLKPLTRSVRYYSTRAAVAVSSRRTTLQATVMLLIITFTSNSLATASSISIDTYKLYAHIKIVSAKQYACLDTLWTHESNWNPKAKNKKSSAFGIPQLLKMTTKDPFEQIDLGLKYIATRHITACQALSYFGKHRNY